MFLALLLLVFAVNSAKAEIFCDSAYNLFSFDDQNIFLRSNDFGKSWSKIAFSVTYEANYLVSENSDKRLVLFWQKNGDLYASEGSTSNSSFSIPNKILTSFYPDKFDVYVNNGTWNIFYGQNGNIYYLASSDKGKTFTTAQVLNGPNKTISWSLLKQANGAKLFYVSDKRIWMVDMSSFFRFPQEMYASENEISGFIGFKYPYIPEFDGIIWTEKNIIGGSRIKYLASKEASPRVIYETNNPMTSAEAKYFKNTILITYAESINRTITPYLLLIHSDGALINNPKLMSDEFNRTSNNLGAFPMDNKLKVIYQNKSDMSSSDLINSEPTVSMSDPVDMLLTNNKSINIVLRSQDPDNDKLYYSLKVSRDKNFQAEKTLSYEIASMESKIDLPEIDGTYFLKAIAFDGISEGSSQDIRTIIVDMSVVDDINAPRIDIIYPGKNAYFKSNSTIAISAKATDKNHDLIDEAEAEVYLDNIKSDESLFYSSEDSSLSGLIPLNKSLKDGLHKLSVKLKNNSGNVGVANFYIIIDNTPHPTQANAPSNILSSASGSKIVVLENGPNPFKPSTGEPVVIKYELAKPSDIEFYVFSLLGDIVYTKKSSVSAAGNFSWEGKDPYGKIVPAGIYPYVFIATDGSAKDLKRGKIIVF